MTTETTIDPRILDIALAYEGAFKIDGDNTIIMNDDVTPEEFVSGLLKDVDLETVKKVDQEKAILTAGFLLGAGRMAVNHCGEHADVKRVSGEIKVGLDTVTLSYAKPTTRNSEGAWRDPNVTAVNRRYEHTDHGKVRREIYAMTKSIMS